MDIRVAVIGAGIVGACIAHTLRARGAQVDLIDRDEPGAGASAGNSGAISPYSVTPVGMPGVAASVPRMLIDPYGALRLPIGYLPRAAPWLVRFVAASTARRVEAIADRLAVLHHGATELHRALTREVGVPELFLQRGHLHLYPDEAALDADAHGWALRERHGYRHERLGRAAILELEPRLSSRYQAGAFLADQATIVDPLRYLRAIVADFTARGGRLTRAAVTGLERSGSRWRLLAEPAATQPDYQHVVVAGGAWSRRLLDPLGVVVHLESQRGYHVQFTAAGGLVSRTVVLADRKVFVTPMRGGLRVGGTVEIAGLARPADPRRFEIMRRVVGEAFEQDGDRRLLAESPQTEWMGHRPCMPDSVPRVGPAGHHPGLWLSLGHGHLGLTNSARSGVLIADAILGG